MPNFAPTEEQEEIRSLARSLAIEQLRAQGRASEQSGDISPTLAETLAQTGLTTPFPEQLGGSGAIEAVTYTLIAEELGFGDGALAMNIIGSLVGPVTVMLAGTRASSRNTSPPFCDASSGPAQRGSFAYAERTGGYTLADISATARKEGDYYIVNGTKRDVIYGAVSSPRVVLLRLEGTSGLDGLCALMVPAQGEGITLRNDALKLGLIAAPSASYDFTNAPVSASCMLGAARRSRRDSRGDAVQHPARGCGLRHDARGARIRHALREGPHRLWPAHRLLPGHRLYGG